MRYVIAAVVTLTACKHDAGPEFFGSKVAPPGALATVKYGETVDELKKQFPDAKLDKGQGYLLGHPAKNVKLFAVEVDGVIVDPYVSWDGADGIATLTKAWGPPDQETDRENKGDTAWRNVETGWRASVFCGHGTDATPLPPFCTIKFMPHKPLDAMFEKAIHPPGELAASHMGMTKPDFAKLVPLDPASKGTHIRNLAYDGATELAMFDDKDKLTMLHYTAPEIAGPMIQKAWGPGVVSGDETLYFDPATHWAVSVEHKDKDQYRLSFTSYDTFDHEIDLASELSHLEAVAAKKAHPELDWRTDKDRDFIMFAPHEFASEAGRMMSGVATSIYPGRKGIVLVQLFDHEQLESIRAALTKKWGTPILEKPRKDDPHRVHYYWPGHGEISGDDSPDGGSLGLFIDADARAYEEKKK